MSNLTGVHDSQLCAADNGQPCVMCCWADASQSIPRREMDDWDLDRELNEFANRYGEQALADKLDLFMTGRGIY